MRGARAFIRALFSFQRRRARALGIPTTRAGSSGAITVVQRFGSALQLTPHLHTLLADGVFVRDDDDPDARPRFRPLAPPTDDDVADLLATMAHRVLAPAGCSARVSLGRGRKGSATLDVQSTGGIMSTWAEASKDGSNPWAKLDDPSGTAMSLPGQHDLTGAERTEFKARVDADTAAQGKALSQQTGGRVTKVSDAMASSAAIYESYFAMEGGDAGREAYIKAARQAPLGDVNDPAQRLKTMSMLTQDTGKDSPDRGQAGSESCAGASIVGAAFLAEGPAGISKVMAAIEKFDPDGLVGKYASDEYKALKAKLKDDPSGKTLSMADLQTLQQTTTQVLNSNEKGEMRDAPAVHNSTMDNFLEKSTDLRKMFDKSGMEIENIDNDGVAVGGSRTNDHYVLKIKGQGEHGDMIYDSLARRGGQIIDCQQGVEHYNRATMDTIGDDKQPWKK